MDIPELMTKNFYYLKGDEVFHSFFANSVYPWELLEHIASFLLVLGPQLPEEKYIRADKDVWIARTASVAEYVTIKGPTIIGEGCQIRPGAYIRGSAFIGEGSGVGNSTEIKNSMLLGKVEAPHFNYIGDSILSYGAHLGAGVITSNMRSDRKNIKVRLGDEVMETGLRKFGAMIAEKVEIGCNAVLNPGILIGAGSIIYPLSLVRKSVPRNSIYKNQGEVTHRQLFG
ncbi:MAG: UDP-N-acetylglucosamine pyrophosphorylase [Clostridiaceae bacterium]|nr:UDP-N-acetylglucosamine pyrophosphorylase [Clostridiaceae bacterium]